jgi:hypothetical protein
MQDPHPVPIQKCAPAWRLTGNETAYAWDCALRVPRPSLPLASIAFATTEALVLTFWDSIDSEEDQKYRMKVTLMVEDAIAFAGIASAGTFFACLSR